MTILCAEIDTQNLDCDGFEFTARDNRSNIDNPCFVFRKSACEKTGGLWDAVGRKGIFTCRLKSSDGGNKCTDNNECEMDCIIAFDTLNVPSDKLVEIQNSGMIIGQCETHQTVFGCKTTLKNGNIFRSYCVD